MSTHTARRARRTRRMVTGLALAVALTAAYLGVTAMYDAHTAQHTLRLTAAQQRCLVAVIDDVMTAEPEYPQDVAPRALASCGITVVVSHDPDGEWNFRPIESALTSVRPY